MFRFAKTVLASAVCGSSLVLSGAWAGVIFQQDFEVPAGGAGGGAVPWAAMVTDVMPATPLAVDPSFAVEAAGTVNKAGSTEASGGLVLTTEVGDVSGEWQAIFASGLIPVKNTERNLDRLTLSFDVAVSATRPVKVRFESFDAGKKRTGGLEAVIYPATTDHWLRSAVDLSTMKAFGGGTFRPTDPFVQVSFVAEGPAFGPKAKHVIRVDNVCYTNPTFYVSPSGSDTNDGATEKTPLKTPQLAVDKAKPGDVIMLMNGTYDRPAGNTDQNGIIHFDNAGTPSAWIVLRNFPGHKPMLFNTDSWDTIRIGGPIRKEGVAETEVAYFEIRGLHVRGNADKVKEQHAALVGLPRPQTNGNGITVSSRGRTLIPHHFRVADCTIELQSGGGFSGLGGDYFQVENNIVENNCWFMIYAGSGISLLDSQNYDGVDDVTKMLIRNNHVSWNRCYMPWAQIKKMSDGNGIIIDTNDSPAKGAAHVYNGRSLIQNNVAVANGGSGIHTYKSRRVDIVNNTVYMNAATPELSWGQLFVNRASDVRVVNNVVYGREGLPINTVSRDVSDKGNTKVVRQNNVYAGSSNKIAVGENDVMGDPLFVMPTIDLRKVDLRVKSESPVLKAGRWDVFVPLTDISGKPRPLGSAPDAGAYQH